MPRRSAGSVPSDLFDLVVKNALDFLKQSVRELRKRPKYSVIDFCSALELLLKARFMLEHWALIISRPESASLVKFQAGDFRSVTMDDAIERLRNVGGEPISRDEETSFRGLREHRNKLVHFFHEQYVKAPPDEQAIQEVVSEQCKAWFYLHRLLVGRWARHFRKYAAEIRRINAKMEVNRVYLRAKYEAISPEIEKDIAGGTEYARCASCGFEASCIEVLAEPLYKAACRVCGSHRSFLRVACPECGETITVEDLGEADCPNEDFTTDVQWLIGKYGQRIDPKEDTEIAYCSYCERTDTPTAIPYADFEYLCLSCVDVHDSASNCDWCEALSAGLGEDSYLNGCVVCGGKFDSESFHRE